MNLLKKWQGYGPIFLVIFLLLGCATTPIYYTFTPTILNFQINAPIEKTYSLLQKEIKNHPFKILTEFKDDYAIVVTSRFSTFGKAGLFVGKILMGASYNDEIYFMVIPKEQGCELRISITAYQRMAGVVEQITVDPKHQLYKQVNLLAQEVKKQAGSY